MTPLFLLLYFFSILIVFAIFEWIDEDDDSDINIILATVWPICLVALIIYASFYYFYCIYKIIVKTNKGREKDGGTTMNNTDELKEIFSELKESEDERIKKDLIQWINEFPDIIWRGHYKKDIIAWLEKQGNHKVWTNNDYERIKSIEYLLHELDNHNFDDWFNALKK